MAFQAILQLPLAESALLEAVAAHKHNHPADVHSSYDVVLNGDARNKVCQVQEDPVAPTCEALVQYFLCKFPVIISEGQEDIVFKTLKKESSSIIRV